MFCSKCNKELPNGTRFCDKCGVALPVNQSGQPVSPVRAPVHYSLAPTVLDVDSPSVSALKGVVRSPLMVFAVLAMLAQLVLSIVCQIRDMEQIQHMAQEMSVELSTAGFYAIIAVAALIPLLFIVGLSICLFGAARKKGMPTVGFTMLRILVYVDLGLLVLSAVVFIISECMNLTYLIQSEHLDAVEFAGIRCSVYDAVNLFIAMLVVSVVLSAVGIFFMIRVASLLKAAKEVTKTGKTARRASVFSAIVCIIYAVMAAVAALGLYLLPTLDQGTEIPMFAQIDFMPQVWQFALICLAALCLGMLMLSYRTKVQPLAEIPKPIPVGKAPTEPEEPVQEETAQGETVQESTAE